MSTTSLASSANSLNAALATHTNLKEEAIHLFRALLRESTYLPDPASRTFISNLTFKKFSKDRRKRRYPGNRNNDPELWSEQNIRSSLKQGHDTLKYIRRANAGHTRQLTSILYMTYGRIRNRRHELLSSLKSPAASLISESSPDASASPPSQNEREWGPGNLSPPLQALVRSQSSRPTNNSPRRSIKSTAPNIPEQNAWGRPMPIKRVENMEKRWLAETLDGVMPPLPADEWERLRRLTIGEERWEGPVRRRPRARSRVSAEGEGHAGIKGGVGGVELVIERDGVTHKHEVNEGKREGERTYISQGKVSRPHTLTPRYMRRLWRKVLRLCPKMERVDGEGWKMQWTDAEREKNVEMKAKGSKMLGAMFVGVDVKGKVPR